MGAALAEQLDRLLPQTQCTRCGYSGCRPYADALAAGQADINQCPPGGAATAAALAALLGMEAKPVDPARGTEGPPRVAIIAEADCIGCAKCLPACPVDAIVGARRQLHTVIASECSGCELCLPPCPVDCITMVDAGTAPLPLATLHSRAARYRERFRVHEARAAARLARRIAQLSGHRPGAGAS